MRFEYKKWRIELLFSRKICRAKIPLRLKLTFYIGTVALICMAMLAAICIVQSLTYTQKLMQERLSQFAASSVQQIERDITSQAAYLNAAVQGDSVTSILANLFDANSTTEVWSTNMEGVIKFLFSTTLKKYQAIYLYDNTATLLLSMANPDVSNEKLKELNPAIPKLLPLRNVESAQDLLQAPNNLTDTVINGTRFSNVTYGAHPKSEGLGVSTSAAGQKGPKLNFHVSEDDVASWLSEPVALSDGDDNIIAYSISHTMPIRRLFSNSTTQVSYFVGYVSGIIDCSQYLNANTDPTSNYPLLVDEMRKTSLAIIDADIEHGWRYLFPTGKATNYNTTVWNHFGEFPAILADLDLENHHKNSTDRHKAGGAIMNTRIPNISKASVGFSFANVFNRKWLVTLSLPESEVERSYHKQTQTLLGVALGVLIFVFFAAFFVTGLTTNPVFHIYRGMVLIPHQRDESSDQSESTQFQSCNDHEALTNIKKGSNLIEPHSNSSVRTLISSTKISPSPLLKTNDNETDKQKRNQAMHVEDLNTQMYEDTTSFQVPQPLEPLNRRWISDEFDELIDAYNKMIDRLSAQYMKIEDEVKARTREAREIQQLAEAANAAKSYFMMNISHELLTPMNGIMGITAVTIEETDLAAIRASLRTIIKSGSVLQEILQELLNYATHLAGVEERYHEFVINELVFEVHSTFATRADANGIDFEMYFCNATTMSPPNNKWIVESDLEVIKHICTSLISNAIKFSSPSKTASTLPKVEVFVSLSLPDKKVDLPLKWGTKTAILEVIVADSGIGIRKDRLAHIFELFVQGDDALSKRFNGTGLGLALSKLLCERLGGCIEVYTRFQIGTTVAFRVPVHNIHNSIILPSKAPKLESTPVFRGVAHADRLVWKADSRKPGTVNCTILPKPTEIPGLPASSQELAMHSMPILSTPYNNEAKTLSALSVATLVNNNCDITKSENQGPTPLKPQDIRSRDYKNKGILLPTSPSLPHVHRATLDSVQARSLRVLVADDNKVMRELLSRILTVLGIGHVDTACDGDTAIQKVEEAIVAGMRYSMIFMDLTMPETDGIQATHNIRKQLGYFCPVVALTGYSDSKTFERCIKAGIQKVLVKPVSRLQLAQIVSELVNVKIV